jgi:UDP-glucuronate decarboxylase
MAGEPLQIYGHGDQTSTFCYVTDAINGFLRVLLSEILGDPYNIGNPSPEISMKDIVKENSKALGNKPV